MSEDAVRRDVLVQAGLALASEHSLPDLLQKIVELACTVSKARYGALGVLGPDGLISQFLTRGITDEERRAIGPLPTGGGILGVLIHEAHPLRLRRISDHPLSVGFPPHHPPMNSFLGVPVAIRGTVFGDLYLTEKKGGAEFTSEDEETVVTLAAQAAVAIENARLHEEVQRLAVVEDRERIAKELHDDIVQSLFAEGMALEAARAHVQDPVATDARLSQAVDNLDRMIRDLRNYIFGLRPGRAADRHLADALHHLADSFHGSDAVIEIDVDEDLAPLLAGKARDLVPAAREALSNAVRHAGAGRIRLALARAGDVGVLTVEDDGSGFDMATVEGKGDGLRNLRTRAEAIGGSLAIDSADNRGTRVVISIPL